MVLASRDKDYKYDKSQTENRELKKQWEEFVHELSTIIVQKAYDEIIYIDETTFHLW